MKLTLSQIEIRGLSKNTAEIIREAAEETNLKTKYGRPNFFAKKVLRIWGDPQIVTDLVMHFGPALNWQLTEVKFAEPWTE